MKTIYLANREEMHYCLKLILCTNTHKYSTASSFILQAT